MPSPTQRANRLFQVTRYYVEQAHSLLLAPQQSSSLMSDGAVKNSIKMTIQATKIARQHLQRIIDILEDNKTEESDDGQSSY